MIIKDIPTLREQLLLNRQQKKIALVPTMGNLHAGHLQLVKLAQQHGNYVVVSIFVNPMQFGPNEDFASYPRTLSDDVDKLSQLNVDAIFTPTIEEIYPLKLDVQTQVSIPLISNELCGFFRPGFFTGIATVVTKLFNIVQPHVAIFGEKDFQQLQIIRQLVNDLCFDIEIIAAPIVREKDGLAMSSRNQYLQPQERLIACNLYQQLQKTAEKMLSGNMDFHQLEKAAQNSLSTNFKVDYFSVRNRNNLTQPTTTDRELILLVAAWLGKARLIDNIFVDL